MMMKNSLFYVGIANQLPTSFTAEWPFEVDIEAMIEGDSAVYLEMVMDRVTAEAPNLVNAMLDLTWNTGGNVGALYRVIGFITDEPFMTARISGDTGGASSSFVYIDGVPVYKELNWALLTSPLTFSAANSLATIFKMNDLGPIIGLTSGGGASSITPILLPSGTSFTTSSNSVGAIRTGSGTDEDPYVYENNEFGITPDIVIDITDIYDEEILITAFN
jgi:C-terminal processing protease CtpA/Prc